MLQYLGSQEVFESRGIHVCEDAVKVLKAVSFSHQHEIFVYVCACSLSAVDINYVLSSYDVLFGLVCRKVTEVYGRACL